MNAMTPSSAIRGVNASESSERRRAHRIVAASFGTALGYATIRYNLFKGVPWADWPVYIVNKAAAVGALILMVIGVQAFVRRRPARRLLAWAGAAMLLHCILSLSILDPHYFPKLFADGKVAPIAGFSLLLGAVAAVGMEVGARKSGALDAAQRVWALASIACLSGLHAAATGFSTWFYPGQWPGFLPPITLISLLLAFGAVLIAWRAYPYSSGDRTRLGRFLLRNPDIGGQGGGAA